MSNASSQIKVTSDIKSSKQALQARAKELYDIRSALRSAYEYAENMGQSRDLGEFHTKFYTVVNRMTSLANTLYDYTRQLNTIEANYKNAQEQAIYRAMSIPK